MTGSSTVRVSILMRARPGASKGMSSSMCRCLRSAHSITGPERADVLHRPRAHSIMARQRAEIRIDPDLASRHLSMLQATGLLLMNVGGREIRAWG